MIDFNFSVLLNAPDPSQGELALIRARGADAGSFLQGQLTQDVLLMKPDEARLAAWCSAKGRMLASFFVVKLSSEEFVLILSRDLLAATLKRMKMFVLRAKCELTDASGDICVEGLTGAAAQLTTNTIAARADSMPAMRLNDSEIMVFLAAGHMAGNNIPRALRIRSQAPQGSADAQNLTAWNALEITSGIARLSAAVSEAFVPQMLK
jgi:tRNA-modifying protein YgfZ